jgi:hypothetical protein
LGFFGFFWVGLFWFFLGFFTRKFWVFLGFLGFLDFMPNFYLASFPKQSVMIIYHFTEGLEGKREL